MSHEDQVEKTLAGAPNPGAPPPGGAPPEPGDVPLEPPKPAWQKAIMRLFEPYPKTPDEFTGTATARAVNNFVEKKAGTHGEAEEARIGESCALCLDALGFEKAAGHWPPIQHLLMSFGKFFFLLRTKAAKATKKGDKSEVEKP